MIDFSTFPATRKAAKAAGAKYWYAGIVCKKGHDVPWYTDCNQCTACKRVKRFLPSLDPVVNAPLVFVHLLADWRPVVGWS